MVLTTVSPGSTYITHSDIYDTGTERFFGATTLIPGKYARVTMSPGDIYCTVPHMCTY